MYGVTLLTILYLVYVFFIFLPRIEENTISLENSIGEIQLEKIAQIIQISAKNLQSYENLALQNKKNELQRLTNIVWDIVNTKYQSSTEKTTKESQQEVLTLLRKLTYANNDYFFVSNYNNILLSHPYLQGIDFTYIKDMNGNLIVPPMVEIARKKGFGFTRYWWKKNSDNNKIFEKLSFVKDFAPWQWVIGTGVYIDDIANEVQKRKEMLLLNLKKILASTKIGKSGYIYIFDESGKVVIHPNEALEGTDGSKIINPTTNRYIMDDLIKAYKKGDKKLYYLWDKPDDIGNFSYEKISWIEYDPYFQWYIVSSGYVDEFYENSNNLKVYIIYSVIFVSIFLMIIGFVFLRKILVPVVKLAEYAKEVKHGRLDIRYRDKIEDDETGVLAVQFNEMLDIINNQIKNLDNEVEKKTQALTLALNEKEVLLREVQHRVKNNLNVINSIIGLQTFQEKQPPIESFIKTLQQRINSMSLAHELLNRSKNMDMINVPTYITTLVDSLIAAYDNPETCKCHYDIDDFELDIDKLLSCGLIINELVTNSIKHVFKGNPSYLYISAKCSGNSVILSLKDAGMGFDENVKDGIGLGLIKTLIYQLRGTVQFANPDNPVTVIKFKIS